MSARDKPPAFDERLWFHHKGCSGRHFLLGNAHTVSGRMRAWCPKEGCGVFVSLPDMGRMSAASRFWIQGFLSGNEPRPPIDDEDLPPDGGPPYRKWLRKVQRFQKTGIWPAD